MLGHFWIKHHGFGGKKRIFGFTSVKDTHPLLPVPSTLRLSIPPDFLRGVVGQTATRGGLVHRQTLHFLNQPVIGDSHLLV